MKLYESFLYYNMIIKLDIDNSYCLQLIQEKMLRETKSLNLKHSRFITNSLFNVYILIK